MRELAERLDQLIVRYVNEIGPGVIPVSASHFDPVVANGDVLHGWRNIYVGNTCTEKTNGVLRTLRMTLRHYRTRVRWAGIFA